MGSRMTQTLRSKDIEESNNIARPQWGSHPRLVYGRPVSPVQSQVPASPPSHRSKVAMLPLICQHHNLPKKGPSHEITGLEGDKCCQMRRAYSTFRHLAINSAQPKQSGRFEQSSVTSLPRTFILNCLAYRQPCRIQLHSMEMTFEK